MPTQRKQDDGYRRGIRLLIIGFTLVVVGSSVSILAAGGLSRDIPRLRLVLTALLVVVIAVLIYLYVTDQRRR